MASDRASNNDFRRLTASLIKRELFLIKEGGRRESDADRAAAENGGLA
jgi:hypothetical protein